MSDEEQQTTAAGRDLTAQIVAGYVAGNKLPPDEIANLISAVHHALARLGGPVEPVVERKPAVRSDARSDRTLSFASNVAIGGRP